MDVIIVNDLLAPNAEDPKAEGRAPNAEVLLEVLPKAAVRMTS